MIDILKLKRDNMLSRFEGCVKLAGENAMGDGIYISSLDFLGSQALGKNGGAGLVSLTSDGSASGGPSKAQERLLLIGSRSLVKYYSIIQGMGMVLTLCDASGQALRCIGDKGMIDDAYSAETGKRWDNGSVGLNAIGITAADSTVGLVRREEHAMEELRGWSGVSAPVFSHDKRLLGILALSTEHEIDACAVALVSSMAESVTLQLDARQFRTNLPTLNLRSVEEQCIRAALESNHNNIDAAASELGISKATLYRRLKEFHIVREF